MKVMLSIGIFETIYSEFLIQNVRRFSSTCTLVTISQTRFCTAYLSLALEGTVFAVASKTAQSKSLSICMGCSDVYIMTYKYYEDNKEDKSQ